MTDKQAELIAETLKDMLIVQLALARVPQRSIRKIVGGDINRINKVARHLKNSKIGAEPS